MIRFIRVFEKAIAVVLIVLLAVVIVLSTVDLGSVIVKDVLRNPNYLFDVRNLLSFLGIVIPIVIAVELLGTVRVYIDERAAKIEVIFLIAMMAIAREVIVLDFHKVEGIVLVGVAAIIGALSVGFFLLRRCGKLE